jgi:hypothetical protein
MRFEIRGRVVGCINMAGWHARLQRHHRRYSVRDRLHGRSAVGCCLLVFLSLCLAEASRVSRLLEGLAAYAATLSRYQAFHKLSGGCYTRREHGSFHRRFHAVSLLSSVAALCWLQVRVCARRREFPHLKGHAILPAQSFVDAPADAPMISRHQVNTPQARVDASGACGKIL